MQKLKARTMASLLETILENGTAYKAVLSSGDLFIVIDGTMVNNSNNEADILNEYKI
ncbi:hypothetical protein [Candidatus Kinetoplastidibacterium blastocrithidiae]|uniref:hypothetical protein n=1 Tax=Candidatus Kinetoplastidibacterium blastocrithidiae TaxID=233181 RepID=UPI0004AC9FDF|nr:hypothetical protein [Candidatus Kinetoplastibacterium blastocrithidii]